jgi:hypothetical protein
VSAVVDMPPGTPSSDLIDRCWLLNGSPGQRLTHCRQFVRTICFLVNNGGRASLATLLKATNLYKDGTSRRAGIAVRPSPLPSGVAEALHLKLTPSRLRALCVSSNLVLLHGIAVATTLSGRSGPVQLGFLLVEKGLG